MSLLRGMGVKTVSETPVEQSDLVDDLGPVGFPDAVRSRRNGRVKTDLCAFVDGNPVHLPKPLYSTTPPWTRVAQDTDGVHTWVTTSRYIYRDVETY